ncbi:MAG: hypothetical protein VXA56_13665, partial [Deltaproteobacteria bacterium]
LGNWNEVSLSMVSAREITTKDRLGTIKEIPQWIKKYHELIVANEFLTSGHPSSRLKCRRCSFGTQGSFSKNFSW